MSSNRIGKQREVLEKAFGLLGGIDKLVQWSQETDDKGNKRNYGEFLKLYVKLVPPIKPDTSKSTDTQESFIMSLIKADNILKISEGKPQALIEVDAIENQSHDDKV